jgi:predicted dehydrogenase
MVDYQRDVTERVRVGLVGAGMHAYRNILPTLTFLPVELVAIADVDLDLAERTARQYGARAYGSTTDMYASESLDAVLLCVSAFAHPNLAIEAFNAGLHVWMEKPASVGVEGINRMLAAQGDRVAVVGYKKAFMPATTKVIELTEGRVPNTILATYPMAVPQTESYDHDALDPTASLWLENGCHPLSFLVRVAGPVASVSVHRASESSGAMLLRHRSGTLSNLHLALGAPYSQPFERYSVYGQDVTVEVENSRRVRYQRGVPLGPKTDTFVPTGLASGAVVWEPQDSMSTFEGRAEVTQGLYGSLAHFAACVLTRSTPRTADLPFARHLAALHAAAIVSDGDTIEIGDRT